MKSVFNLENPIGTFLEQLFDDVLLGVLWLLFSLPLITLGASTAACFQVLFARKQDKGSGVLRPFWRAFCGCFLQGTGITLLVLAINTVVLLDFRWLQTQAGGWWTQVMFGVCILVLLFCAMLLLYGLSQVSLFRNSLRRILLNSLRFGLGHFGRTLILLLLNALALVIVILAYPSFFLVFPAIMAINTRLLWPVYQAFVQTAEPLGAA